jgi:hypothetical protein
VCCLTVFSLVVYRPEHVASLSFPFLFTGLSMLDQLIKCEEGAAAAGDKAGGAAGGDGDNEGEAEIEDPVDTDDEEDMDDDYYKVR